MFLSKPFILQPESKETVSVKKRKFSSFFKNIVIELDRELYGPDNHLVEVKKFKKNFPLLRFDYFRFIIVSY